MLARCLVEHDRKQMILAGADGTIEDQSRATGDDARQVQGTQWFLRDNSGAGRYAKSLRGTRHGLRPQHLSTGVTPPLSASSVSTAVAAPDTA